jgi:hypothetical protein
MEPRAGRPEIRAWATRTSPTTDPSDLPLGDVPVEEAAARHGRRESEREEKHDPGVVIVLQAGHLLRWLEADVLERFGRTPVEAGRCAIVAAARRQVSLGDPRCGAVAEARKLFEARLG